MNANVSLLAAALALSAFASPAFAQSAAERVADEGTIGDKWMLADSTAPLAQAAYPAHLAARGDSVCVAVGYLIGKDGATSDFKLLKGWNSAKGEIEPDAGYWQAFADSGAEAIAQWKFKARPGVADPVPTRTVATIGFQGTDGTQPAAVRGHCKIAGLAGYMAKMESDRTRDDDINKHALDKAMQSQRRAEARVGAARNGN